MNMSDNENDSLNDENSMEIEMLLNDDGYLVDNNGNFIQDDNGNQVLLGDKEIEMLRVNGQLEEVYY